MTPSILESLPLWVFFGASCAGIALSWEFGHWLGRRMRARSPDTNDPSLGVMVGSILGLLAFLLAFTFGVAASRFESRRQVLLKEANSIGTTYLRARLLPQSIRGPVEDELRMYVDVRLAAMDRAISLQELERGIERSEQLLDSLWSRAVEAVEQSPTPITSLFVQALNDTIDVHSERVMVGARSRIPSTIWLALLSLTFVAFASCGVQVGVAGAKRSIIALALVLGFSMVLTLIADLDRPREGTLTTSQSPLVDLRSSMSSTR